MSDSIKANADSEQTTGGRSWTAPTVRKMTAGSAAMQGSDRPDLVESLS